MPRKKKDDLTDEVTMLEAEAVQDEGSDEAGDMYMDSPDDVEVSIDDDSDDDFPTAEISFEVSGEIVSETPLPEEAPDDVSDASLENQGDDTPTLDEAQLVRAKVSGAAPRRKSITELNLKKLDRNLSPLQRQEWEGIYASFRSKSLLTGTVMGVDSVPYTMFNRETGETESKTLHSLTIIGYRVKVLIPETELWFPGEERPDYLLSGMVGSQMDYVIVNIDREGEFAIGSRRMALNKKRRRFARGRHELGQPMQCKVIAVGPRLCTVECQGYDISLRQRELSYTPIPDLRERYHPGQELTCLFNGFDNGSNQISILVKEVNPNPFDGADLRHPIGSRRHAVISGKYAGGVFCALPDETTCLCLYSTMHADADFQSGDSVIVYIAKYDYKRQLIYGRILAKW